MKFPMIEQKDFQQSFAVLYDSLEELQASCSTISESLNLKFYPRNDLGEENASFNKHTVVNDLLKFTYQL